MNRSMKEQDSLSAAWAAFEELSKRLTRYLETSEKEFGSLIEALGACGNLTENMQKATTQMAVTGAAADSQTEAIRQSMLKGCRVFRTFMTQIRGVSGELTSAAEGTRELLGTSNYLQEILAPLKHIAFQFRLEGSRLSAEDNASILSVYEEMQDVLSRMKQAGDSQEHTLLAILGKLLAATRSVEQASVSYAARANESEERVQRNLDLLSQTPRDLLRARNRASVLGPVTDKHLGQAIVALQGHDAIRQRLEHVLAALARLRTEPEDEPEHVLLLQSHQARSVREQIVNTGSRIEQELNGLIASAQRLADDTREASGGQQVDEFEKVVDRLASSSSEVVGLLEGEVNMGTFVLAQIDPIRELLRANGRELEALAVSMRSMKRLALNVLISAEKMPSARGIGVLGALTSEGAGGVLKLERNLTVQFAMLDATLQSQGATITADVHGVESCRNELMTHGADDSFRNSRRMECDGVIALSQEARQLTQKTEALVQSLKFVDEGTELFGELDVALGRLLALYPKSAKPFDLKAASAGYTMQEQHDAHALVGGAAEKINHRLTEPAEGEAYGDNVELF